MPNKARVFVLTSSIISSISTPLTSDTFSAIHRTSLGPHVLRNWATDEGMLKGAPDCSNKRLKGQSYTINSPTLLFLANVSCINKKKTVPTQYEPNHHKRKRKNVCVTLFLWYTYRTNWSNLVRKGRIHSFCLHFLHLPFP